MTKKLAFVIVGVVVATLLLAGFGSLVVGNLRARQTTRVELRDQAKVIADNLEGVLDTAVTIDNPAALRRRVRLLDVFRNVLDLDGLAVITINRNGRISGDELPAGITEHMLAVDRLRSGDTVVGNDGNLVYAAAPSQLPGE